MRLEFKKILIRKRKALDVNGKTCSGCQLCEMACSLVHEGSIDPQRSRLTIRANPFKGSYLPRICRHCSDAPCLRACEASAIQIREKDGTVFIDEEKCTGCGLCLKKCPFGAIRFDSSRKKAFKCDFCQGTPECVKWCPTHSLGITKFGG